MEGDVPHSSYAMPFQPPAFFFGLEHPLDGWSFGVQVFPLGAVSADHSEEPYVFCRVLPVFSVAVEDAALGGVQQVAPVWLAAVQVVSLIVGFNVLHGNHSDASRNTFAREDALMQFFASGLLTVRRTSDVDNRLYALVAQIFMILRGIVAAVSDDGIRVKPVMQGLGLFYQDGKLSGVIPFAGCNELRQWNPVIGVRNHVNFISKKPFRVFAGFGFGGMFDSPTGLGVADALPVRVTMGADCRGVHGDFRPQIGQPFPDLLDHFRHAGFDEVGVMAQPRNEPIEGGPVREGLAEPA